MPPPLAEVLLLVTVVRFSVAVAVPDRPSLKRPLPFPAELPINVLSLTVRVAFVLKMPPPYTVAELPRHQRTVMLRSYFLGDHPTAVAGYHATQLAQYMDQFVSLNAAGKLPGYRALVMQAVIDP